MILTSVPSLLFACSGTEPDVLYVDNTRDLIRLIQRDGVELVLAGTSTDTFDDPRLNGRYVLAPCPGGDDEERRSADCGELEQGRESILRSDLELPLGPDGVPTGEFRGGAIIDCSRLPPSAREFSCVRAGDGSVIRGLTITDGFERPAGDPRGGDPAGPDNRNGILVPAGGSTTVIEGVRILNVRRGVIATTASGRQTRVRISGLSNLWRVPKGRPMSPCLCYVKLCHLAPGRRPVRAIHRWEIRHTRVFRRRGRCRAGCLRSGTT